MRKNRATGANGTGVVPIRDLPTLVLYRYALQFWDDALAQAEESLRQGYLAATVILVPREQIDGAPACLRLKQLMSNVERQLEQVCRHHSTLYWMMLLRRLRPDGLFDYDRPQTGANTQATAELAAMKYGLSSHFDIQGNPQTEVIDLDAPKPPKLPLKELHSKAEQSRLYPRIATEDFYDYVKLCRLAREHYRLTGAYRWIGKGATLLIKNGWDIDVQMSREIESLVDLYDQRLEDADEDFLSHLGLTYPLSLKTFLSAPTKHSILVVVKLGQAKGKIPHHVFELSKEYGIGLALRDFHYVSGFVDLNRVTSLFTFGKDDFRAAHGLDWDVFCAYWHGLTWYLNAQLASQMKPFKLAQWYQRGYIVGPWKNLREQVFEGAALEWYRNAYPGASMTPEVWGENTERFVSMISASAGDIDLHTLWSLRPLVIAGEIALLNLSWIAEFLSEVMNVRVSDDMRDARAATAEALIEERLTEKTPLRPYFERNKEFRYAGNNLGESDLSFRCGSVFVSIDVKSYSVSAGFQRGEYSAVRTRWGNVQEWIAQAERLATRLRDHPRGDNYDLNKDGITHVFTVVCSTFHEYIGSTPQKFFLTPTIPRAAMASELERFFGMTTEAALKAHHCTVSLSPPEAKP